MISILINITHHPLDINPCRVDIQENHFTLIYLSADQRNSGSSRGASRLSSTPPNNIHQGRFGFESSLTSRLISSHRRSALFIGNFRAKVVKMGERTKVNS